MRGKRAVSFSVWFITLLWGAFVAFAGLGYSVDGIRVERTEFGVFEPGVGRGPQVKETTRIPLRPGTAIGWRIRLSTCKRLTWREEFVLPAKAKIWGTTAHTSVDTNGTTAVTEKKVLAVNGWISNTWVLTEGDPPGRYQMKVYVEGRLVASFVFQIEPLK